MFTNTVALPCCRHFCRSVLLPTYSKLWSRYSDKYGVLEAGQSLDVEKLSPEKTPVVLCHLRGYCHSRIPVWNLVARPLLSQAHNCERPNCFRYQVGLQFVKPHTRSGKVSTVSLYVHTWLQPSWNKQRGRGTHHDEGEGEDEDANRSPCDVLQRHK